MHGIYATRVTSNGQDFVAGIVVIDGTSLHGGDGDFLYTGQYLVLTNQRVQATVKIQNYTGRSNLVMGHVTSSELVLEGMADVNRIHLSGTAELKSQGLIRLTLTKIGNLIDPSMGCFVAACAVVADHVIPSHGIAPEPLTARLKKRR